jgi:hypothetical protein
VNDHGAVLSSEAPAAAFLAAFEAITRELRYARLEGATGIDVRIWTSADRACVGVGLAKSLALGFARKLAVRLGKPVRAFTATVTRRGEGYDCLVDDLTLRADGTSNVGRWGTDVTVEFGQNWDDVCDGKPYFAVSALLAMAVESVMSSEADTRQESYVLCEPPSLGHARLDAIASQLRFAERVEHTKLAGRECLRIASGGTTVTSFLEPGDAATLAASGLLTSS